MGDDVRVMSSASDYAQKLLDSLDLSPPLLPAPDISAWIDHDWRSLCGHPGQPGFAPLGPVVAAQGCLLALHALAPDARLPDIDVLTGRARFLGLTRQGSQSCSGGTRLMRASDGPVALTLARPSDRDLVPALVEGSPGPDPWAQVEDWLASVSQQQAAERMELLSLPFAVLGETRAELPWKRTGSAGPSAFRRTPALVVSFASLWAGPLCSQLLRRLGCEVVKVEDPRRPDGTRQGSAALFDELHDGVRVVSAALDSAEVRELVQQADIVVEGSRPRALRRVGLIAEEHPGTWISITGHGRDSDRVAFGDDAAVAGGLVEQGCFIGDAVADPLTGLHAALAGWASHLQGGGTLVDVALARTAATAAALS